MTLRLMSMIGFAAAVAVGGSVRAAPGPKAETKAEAKSAPPAAASGAATPEEAVSRLNAAVAAVKSDPKAAVKVVELFAEPVGESLKTMFTLSAAVGAAQDRFNEALDKKFGKDSSVKQRLPDFGDYEKNFADSVADIQELKFSAKEAAGEDRVLVTVKTELKGKDAAKSSTREDKYLAVKQNGGWRLLPERLTDERMAGHFKNQVDAFRKLPGSLDRLTREVGEGRYRSRQEAYQASFNAYLGILQNQDMKAPEEAK